MTDPIFPDATVTPTPASPRLHALVPCGGRGSRAGDGGPKQYRMVGDRTVLGHTLMALTTVSRLHTVLVVLAPDDDGFESPSVQASLPPSDGRVHLCRQAGATRAHTVANGLRWLRNHGAHESDWVLVHDAARCLVTPGDVNALIDACLARQIGGLLAVPLADTLKSAHADRVQATVGRDDKWLAQTPQMFRLGELAEALDRSAAADHRHITDEASAIEAMGQHPLLVTGSADNFKLTYPPDFARAEAIFRARAQRGGPRLRMGEGWDCHALVPGRPLMLGGVCIPHTHGLLGHSDADVLLHAITDAMLGAAGLGDIGRHFPDTDVRFKGADSKVLLTEAMARVQAAGWRLVNLDATVVAQAPKLARYMPAMVDSVASCLGVSAGQVNLKAKTAERLGPVGQGLSLEARAVALLTSIG